MAENHLFQPLILPAALCAASGNPLGNSLDLLEMGSKIISCDPVDGRKEEIDPVSSD